MNGRKEKRRRDRLIERYTRAWLAGDKAAGIDALAEMDAADVAWALIRISRLRTEGRVLLRQGGGS